MKIFLTGKNGQLGYRLEKDLKQIHEVIATDRDNLDLLDIQLIKDRVYQVKPDLIINAAAYTNVDQAEKEKDLAYQVNTLAPKVLAKTAKALNIPIIHISTDYIFDGLILVQVLERINGSNCKGCYIFFSSDSFNN